MLVQVVLVKTIEISESISIRFVALAPHQMNIYTFHPQLETFLMVASLNFGYNLPFTICRAWLFRTITELLLESRRTSSYNCTESIVQASTTVPGLVSLLELVVPLVEVYVEHHHRPGGQACHQELLIMRESEAADT